jgi:hypothetical protein
MTFALGLVALGCGDDASIHLLEPTDRPANLVHRYDFEGRGAVVADSVGDADGEVLGGAALSGAGSLELDGIDDYVNLPNDILGDSSGASLVAWVTWHGGPCWQRIFDFGRSTAEEDISAQARSSVFVTPASCSASHLGPAVDGVLSSMFHVGPSAQFTQGDDPLPLDREVQVALTLDVADGLRLYLDGEPLRHLKGEFDPRAIECQNDWLGRSQWVQDSLFFGAFDEFRVYDGALSAERIAELFEAGKDEP